MNPTETLDNGLPKYPSLVYRQTGEWQGWDDFLGTFDGKNREVDILEDKVWNEIKHLSHKEQTRIWIKSFPN